jgi:hypothetical protein
MRRHQEKRLTARSLHDARFDPSATQSEARGLQRSALMNHSQEIPPRASWGRVFHKATDLPEQLEASMRSRPVMTVLAVAGVAFVAGTIAGSRVARALLVAAAPVIARRLIDGPLGDDLEGYVKSIFREPASPQAS